MDTLLHSRGPKTLVMTLLSCRTLSQKKTKVMTMSIPNPSVVKVGQSELTNATTFTYLGSIVSQDGCASMDIQGRLSKIRGVFMSVKAVRESTQYSTRTKLRIYQSCIRTTILCGSECWRMTEHKSLRRIIRIFWPRKMSSPEDGGSGLATCSGKKTHHHKNRHALDP